MHGDGRIGMEIVDQIDRFPTKNPPGFGKRIQDLGQYLVGRDHVTSGEPAAHGHSGPMPLVFPMRDRHPIKGIGEDSPHGDGGRFGVP